MIGDLFQQNLKANGVSRVLHTIRKHLGMDVAFISHFRETDRVLEEVDSDGSGPIHKGMTIPLEDGYCLKVVLGELPELIPNTAAVPAAVAIPETHALPIGSHISVPIRLQTGDLYGTLCCFSALPDETLGDRDLKMMRAFAEVLAGHIEENSSSARVRAEKMKKVRGLMTATSHRIVYQPIYGLKTGRLVGLECLSRFNVDLPLSPSQWFDLAGEVDLRQELELVSIRRALGDMGFFPNWVYFGINTSPETIRSGAIAQALEGFDLRRIVVEITEHAIVTDYQELTDALRPLRAQGLRVAIDDAGAGYASMRHIVSLLPDLIKLDISLVQNIDRDPTRRALAKALIAFSKEIGSCITAEGIETQGELNALRQLGADTGQGFLLKHPVPLEDACHGSVQRFDILQDQIHLSIPDLPSTD